MLVDLVDRLAEARVSEVQVLFQRVVPVVNSGLLHDFLKAGVNDVDFSCSLEVLHVGRGLGELVTHGLKDFQILFFLIFLGHAAWRNVFQVLEPLEVRAGHTATVCQHVWNHDDAALHQSFFTHEGCGAVGALEHNLALELVRVVNVD